MKLPLCIIAMIFGSGSLTHAQGTFSVRLPGENLVKNSSFEHFSHTPDLNLAPWKWTGCLAYVQDYDRIPAAEGERFPMVCGQIYQDIVTLPGQAYQLRFAFGGNDQAQQNPEPLYVLWGTQRVAAIPVRGVSLRSPEWRYLDFQVVADQASTRVGFSSLPQQAFPMVDDVSVVAIPEPGIFTLIGFALISYSFIYLANHRVETNRRRAFRFRSWPESSDSYGACVSAFPAAVAHPNR
ncbi:MAG: hypothetical protein HZA90_24830 [Verrucomicrobia bacterium]|nr:hypothetical protein [Verrucomicrobiota bacterium]